jgi:tol-pal system protein YbgF
MWRALAFASLMAAGGAVQAADAGPLRAELGRFRAELAAVRAIQLAQSQDPNLRTAALEVRLSRLEELLRQLTGRIEETEYAQRQTSARIDQLVADLDARLPGREPATEVAAPSTRQTQEALATPAPALPQRTPQPSIISPDQSARQGYVLGTIPEDALRGQAAVRAPALPAPTPGGVGDQARLVTPGADASYKNALDLLQAGNWPAAEQQFTTFVKDYPDDARAPTAAYWLGETYFFRKEYPTAASVFARNYRTYGQEAPRAADNLLKLGMSLAAMGDRNKACQTFGELGKRHPTAPAPIKQALAREKSAAGCS